MPEDAPQNHNEIETKISGTPEPAQAKNDDSKHCDGATKPPGAPAPKEVGGRDGPDPTRYGDWEKAGRCIDF